MRQVGLLAVLALALRSKPAALVVVADHLAAGGARFSSSGRLPLLLWVLNQCARCAPCAKLPPVAQLWRSNSFQASAAACLGVGQPAAHSSHETALTAGRPL